MKKLYKIIAGLMTCLLLVTGCGKDEKATTESCGDMTIEDVNEFLNGAGMGNANIVAVIPFTHINGPRDQWKFYALINFVYRDLAESYVKYQVTYLSCTCRTADVNYWSTAYMELTIPESGEAKDAELRMLSFDRDGTDHYDAGFWGDSSPITSNGKVVATYESMEAEEDKIRRPLDQSEDPNLYVMEKDGKLYYPSIKDDFIPLLVGMTKEEIDSYSVVDDLYDDGVMSEKMFKAFTGASVSTNNILRILHATFKWHAEKYF